MLISCKMLRNVSHRNARLYGLEKDLHMKGNEYEVVSISLFVALHGADQNS